MEVKVWGYLKEYAENKEEILKAVEEDYIREYEEFVEYKIKGEKLWK